MTDADLPAGRELDAIVAEKVMGWTVHRIPDYPPTDLRYSEYVPNPMANVLGLPTVPFYSTSIADAWAVVEKMLAEWEVLINDEQGQWEVSFWEGHRSKAERYNVVEVASTAPLAICRVALRAVQCHTP